uniref:Intradiol ring-cleavage dioxygenases domain-containing protein n=1 Tax=Bionectria ochroleuca TaxID=29856 RepID=A0A0B7KSL9_BIOOC
MATDNPTATFQVDLDNVQPMKDLTMDNITDNVHIINSRCPDACLRFLLERLVVHLHDFCSRDAVEHPRVAGCPRVHEVGQVSSDVRHEFILLSDVLVLSLLVDSIDHPKPDGATDGTVLAAVESISADQNGEPLLVVCTVKDTLGRSIDGVKVDVWETDSKGLYDVQYNNRSGPDGGGVVVSDDDGCFHFKAIVPVPYPIPDDGPVGKLLCKLNRHPYRPSHMHFMFHKPGFDQLITALYVRGSKHETSDAVFGVKQSLIVNITKVADEEGWADKYVKHSAIEVDFVLLTEEESRKLREEKARDEAERQRGLRVENGLLVPN